MVVIVMVMIFMAITEMAEIEKDMIFMAVILKDVTEKVLIYVVAIVKAMIGVAMMFSGTKRWKRQSWTDTRVLSISCKRY